LQIFHLAIFPVYSVFVDAEETTATVIARIPVELKQELVERARDHDRSLSGEMRVLLRGALQSERDGGRGREDFSPPSLRGPGPTTEEGAA
jgi:hypothetical protein